MSKSEHLYSSHGKKYVEIDVFASGMRLVKPKSVNLKLTHRELTLALGIVVALIVAVTLWMNYGQDLQHPRKSDTGSAPVTGMLEKSVVKFRF